MVWRNQDPVADGVVVETWSSPLLSRVMFFGQKELFMLIHHLRGTEMLCWGQSTGSVVQHQTADNSL